LGTGACTAVCDGADRADCHYPDNSKPCGANACTTDQGVGTETHTSVCDMAGHCQDVPRSCGNYTCSATTCKTGCTAGGADCAPGFFCAVASSVDGGVGDASADASAGSDGGSGLACVPVLGLGNKCASAKDCQGGLFCTDGVCCGVDNCGAGKSCNITSKEGRCSQPVGTACTDPADCGPGGFCVDGFCCDRACTDQCEACNVSTSKGICSPVNGDPVGARAKCPGATGSDPCTASTCEGAKDRTKCVGHVGSAVSCRAASCADGQATLATTCDGTGACPAAQTQPCAPFACDGQTCKTECATDADCDPKYRCSNKLCVVGATCQDSHTVLSGEKKTTDCAPYSCVAGKCNTTCNSVADCAEGFACNDSRQCVSLASVGGGPAADEGGCGCRIGAPASRRPWGAIVSLLAAASIVTRRRRKSMSLV
jgi:MYXO-CTERM domain-containing protein